MRRFSHALLTAAALGLGVPPQARAMKCTSPLLENMSGKLGGAVAARARGGIAYFRALVIPTNPNTAMQKAARDAIASAAALWRSTLTEAQQEAWWDYAEGGQTGQGLFTRVNQPRIFAVNTTRVAAQGGADPITHFVGPPTGFSPSTSMTAPTSIVVDDSANTLAITGLNDADPWNADTDTSTPGVLYVYASHQQSASRQARQHPFQMVQAISFGAAATSVTTPINLAPLGFTSETGKVMYIKLRAQHPNGGISTDFIRRVTITA